MKHPVMILLCAIAPFVLAAGTGGGGQSNRELQASASASAAALYRSGLRYKHRAWQQEQHAGDASDPAERDRQLARSNRNFSRAADQVRKALAADENHAEAASELGYALRRTGRYEEAIDWYDHALRVNPDLLQAVEYRGEAYLETGELEAARGAYMSLFRGNADLADQMLAAMEAWTARNEGLEPEFSEWVVERRALRELTRSEASSGRAAW